MPRKPKKPCRHPGCPKLTGGLYCEEHEALHRGDRASSSKRGYNRQWQKAGLDIPDGILTREELTEALEKLCQS